MGIKTGTLYIYFKDGRVFSYVVADAAQARAHMGKIWETGYRSTSDGTLQWYGPHYIDKIKYYPADNEILTIYPDACRGT